ncbi:hypothetical protein QA646_27525 (plasmid) [Rhizobium sp. CB3090]|uniref:hypothetical protein n=1 Tax=Rhizobium sp. CB3090 TaxID=3039156 RepID=UPI0024B15D76|nr:hypothetical protein [Rhizobium sp. CB3090]WFU13096.1 hypothetical protein QA646_27525 [Rhizobium sp. CB3090]
MKLPWKFLTRLTSRRQSAPKSPIEHGVDTDASQSETQDVPELALNPPEPSSGSEPDESRSIELIATDPKEFEGEVETEGAAPVEGDKVQELSPSEVGRPGAEASAVPLESDTRNEAPGTRRTKKPAHAKSVHIDVTAQNTAVAINAQNAKSPSPEDGLFEEVAGLDEEITQLRIQLAQKLLLQNDQLRKMLERFDRS